MEEAQNYFHSGYIEDNAEIRRTLDLAAGALKVFEDRFENTKGGWPYSARPVSEPFSFSNSTNAMIAFALLAASGNVRRSVLLPLRRRVEGLGGLDEDRRAVLRQLVLRSLHTLTSVFKSAGQLRSNTFGINDPFTLTWLFENQRALKGSDDATAFAEIASSLRNAADEVFGRAEASKGKAVLKFPPEESTSTRTTGFEVQHPFPLLRVAQLREVLSEAGHTPLSMSWMRDHFVERLRRNLADHLITDSPFDAADLVFSLEGMLVSGRLPDEPMTEAVFTVIRESQARNAYWRPVRPFIATRQGHALLPLSIEIANSLLRSCYRLEEVFPERSFFSENLHLFKRYVQWLRSRLVDVNLDGKAYQGWHSEHTLSENTIDLWETSQVLVFLLLYADLLKRHVARATLAAARLSVKLPQHRPASPLAHWNTNAVPKEPLQGFDSKRLVYQQIADRFVVPREPGQKTKPSYSMLLYGPPGTGKSGIAEDLAEALGQPLITISPSDFLAEGPNEVEARAKVIFDALVAQSDCVILLDEIDRLILDRDSAMYRDQSDAFQFMTPSMLVKLKTLRAREQAIFVIGTNYFERIDPAARRTGRVDHRFLVMPPNRVQRRRIILHLVKKERLRIETLPDPSGDRFESVLDATALYSYGDLESLVREVTSGTPPTSGEDFSTELLQATADGDPTIRVAAYYHRFPGSDGKAPTAQLPDEEFVSVLEFLDEANRTAEIGVEAIAKLTGVLSRTVDQRLGERAEKLLQKINATKASS